MATYQDIAQLIVSSWALTAPPEDRRIPVSHGVLDRALKSVADQRLLPEWAASELHFSQTRVGMRCVELPDIIEWAQLVELTSVPNPTYKYAEVRVNPRTAARLIQWLEVPLDQASRLGESIRAAVKAEQDREKEPATA